MIRRFALALLLLVPLAGVFSAADEPAKLTDKNYVQTRDYLLPKGDEEDWVKVEWRTTLWDGVIDAQKEDKPIMLFAMNGHPFGCT